MEENGYQETVIIKGEYNKRVEAERQNIYLQRELDKTKDSLKEAKKSLQSAIENQAKAFDDQRTALEEQRYSVKLQRETLQTALEQVYKIAKQTEQLKVETQQEYQKAKLAMNEAVKAKDEAIKQNALFMEEIKLEFKKQSQAATEFQLKNILDGVDYFEEKAIIESNKALEDKGIAEQDKTTLDKIKNLANDLSEQLPINSSQLSVSSNQSAEESAKVANKPVIKSVSEERFFEIVRDVVGEIKPVVSHKSSVTSNQLPVAEVADPIAEVAEPIAEVAEITEPIAEVVEPVVKIANTTVVKSISEERFFEIVKDVVGEVKPLPVAETAEPVAETAEPVAETPEPVAEVVEEPVAEVEEEPVAEVEEEPVAEVANDDAGILMSEEEDEDEDYIIEEVVENNPYLDYLSKYPNVKIKNYYINEKSLDAHNRGVAIIKSELGNQTVFVKYTVDDWNTEGRENAYYREDINDVYELWEYQIPITSDNLQFALCYETPSGEQLWDNNDDMNFYE